MRWLPLLLALSAGSEFERLGKRIDGRLGVCAFDGKTMDCARGQERFSLQSVMKLMVGMAVMDAVDHRGWKVDEPVTVRKQDLSAFEFPLNKLVGETGYKTTVGDLVRRGIIDSDSVAADFLVEKLGGAKKVQEYLERVGVRGVRVDRDEKTLQSEIVGLTWKPEYVDPKVLAAATAAVPDARRAAAYAAYQKDKRDTATPEGMARMLYRLSQGELVSASSTAFLMGAMAETATGPDRLKAGLAPGWKLAHKTGTSGTWKGMAAATNDVGVMTAPDGRKVAVAVFVGDSRGTPEERAKAIAGVARAVK